MQKTKVFRKFSILILAFTMIAVVINATLFYFQSRQEKNTIMLSEHAKVSFMGNYMMEKFNFVVQDLGVLKSHIELDSYLRIIENSKLFSDKVMAHIRNLEIEFFRFNFNKKQYLKVGFFDENGIEQFITNPENQDHSNSMADISPTDLEQHHHLGEIEKLGEGGVYISPMELMAMNGEIQRPYTPILHVATGVLDLDHKFKGFIMLHYRGEELFENLNYFYTDGLGEGFLLNSDGYWLKNSDPNLQWGFMFNDERKNNTLKIKNPTLWDEIEKNGNGQTLMRDGLYTYQTVFPSIVHSHALHEHDAEGSEVVHDREYNWKLLSFVPNAQMYQASRDFLNKSLWISFGFMIVVAILSWFWARAEVKELLGRKKIKSLNEILSLTNKILRHDLANKFIAIRYSLDLYAATNPKECRKLIEGAVKEGINLITGVAKMERNLDTENDFKKIQLKPLIKGLLKQYNIKSKVEGEGTIYADDAVKSLFDNMISNAIVHGKTKEILIRISKKKSKVTVAIIDYGKGIPDKIKQKLFKEGSYFGETGHTGLGLFIARKTVDRYGGKIEISDTSAKGGATFIMTFDKA